MIQYMRETKQNTEMFSVMLKTDIKKCWSWVAILFIFFFEMFMYISWICKCTFDILDYQVLLVVNFNEYGENDGVLFHVS